MSITEFQGFLESEVGKTEPDNSLFHVIPAGYEKSVSYGKGASMGPHAILAASQQLEVFDGIGIPAKKGIFTHPHLDCTGKPEDVLSDISDKVFYAMGHQKTPVLLGGEHTVSVGAFQALKKLGVPVGIVQFDAHADLRNTYEGTPFSHACVMHRAFDMEIPFFQLGTRSLSPDEVVFRKDNSIGHLDAPQLATSGVPEKVLPDDFPETIYITFDLDCFDPSVMTATGTPEPGGLTWYQTMALLEKTIQGREVIGFDVVELAPIKCLHACDFAAARLIYNIMGMIDRSKSVRP